ncbi:MAG: hypothetical protein QG657_2650 [Acidobacteriota bacterium]|nr:hypothetical protein [Acidobacteriota bacterium]
MAGKKGHGPTRTKHGRLAANNAKIREVGAIHHFIFFPAFRFFLTFSPSYPLTFSPSIFLRSSSLLRFLSSALDRSMVFH